VNPLRPLRRPLRTLRLNLLNRNGRKEKPQWTQGNTVNIIRE
jgi:hypothetical protein